MKRNEFLLRLAAENKVAFISETVDVVQIPVDYLDSHERSESCSRLLSSPPPLQSPKQSSSLMKNKEFVGSTVTDFIEDPIKNLWYESYSETTKNYEWNNVLSRPSSNTDSAILNEYIPQSGASSTADKQSIHISSAEELCQPESYYTDLEIGKMALAQPLIEKSTTPSKNKLVNIISDVILKPATSERTTSAYNSSDLTSTMPIDCDIYNFYDENSNQADTEIDSKGCLGFEISQSCKKLTLLTPMSQEIFIDNAPNVGALQENTDGFYICHVNKENTDRQTEQLENKLVASSAQLDVLPSDADDECSWDEYNSSGDEYMPSTNDDDFGDWSSSDSRSEICAGDVHETDTNKSEENSTLANMAEETDIEDTLQRNGNRFDPNTNKLGIKFRQQIESYKQTNKKNYAETSLLSRQQYTRKQSARERPTICPLCFDDVITHFARHLSRHHPKDPEVERMLSMKPKSKERLHLVSSFRKRGNFILKTEKYISHPVRRSKDSDSDHVVCTYCLGLYNRNTLYRHVKVCKNKPQDITKPGKNCLSKSQMFMLSKNHEFLRTSSLKKAVFETMRADFVSKVAMSDPLICLYGEVLLAKHKRQQIATLVSNKIREMAKMLIAIRSMHNNIKGLFDVLKPEMFSTFVAAVKIISGYNENEKNFRAPSLALHMGTNLKIVCNIAFKTVIERKQIPNISWENRNEKKTDIKDLKKLIEAHWCNEISSLALKNLKEKQWQKPNRLPLREDILLFNEYIEKISDNAHENLQNGINVEDNYKKLTECVLAHTIMFNRKRVGDVQYLKIETYERGNSSNSQKAFSESLTDLEKLLCGQFKRVITDGKGSKPVPILFSKRIQRYIRTLLNIRKSTKLVPESNSYLFSYPGVDKKWIRGDYIIRMLARKCGAEQPELLTSTKFRKHIATTLQLMNMGADEMEQVATFMGHTKKTHAQFYRLPQDIYQTAKVAKVLLLLEKGKGKEFRGKNLEEINLDEDYYNSGTSDEEQKYEIGVTPKRIRFDNDIDTTEKMREEHDDEETCMIDKSYGKLGRQKAKNEYEENSRKKKCNSKRNYILKKDSIEKTTEIQTKDEGTSHLKLKANRCRWTSAEKELLRNYFDKHIKNKITPKKHECDQFLFKYRDKLTIKDWVKIKTFVYNTFRQK